MAEAAIQSQSCRDRIWSEIVELGIEEYVADLDANGYTVIPPEIAMPKGLAERMLQACLDVAERRNGERPDLETGATHASMTPYQSGFDSFQTRRERKLKLGLDKAAAFEADSPHGDLMNSILFEDEVFEEGLMNPVLLAIATYMCGYSATLSSMGCWMRGPNKSNFNLHTDMSVPDGLLGPYPFVCQCTYVLTDFDREKGATAFVPGSHKWCRQPVGDECIVPANPGDFGNPNVVPVEAKAGSMLIWHGNTWHGAYNRRAPGLRVSVANYMARDFMRTQEDLRDIIPREMLDRHPPRFGILTQQGVAAGYRNQDDGWAKDARAEKHNAAYAKVSGVRFRPKDDVYN